MGAATASAAVRHTSVDLNTYVDFATNCGRYSTGVINALLEHLRARDGGVKVPYMNGMPDFTLPHGMPSFDSVADMGNMTLVHYNYVATVAHNSTRLYPTFSAREYGVGESHAQQYVTVEEYGANASCVNHIFHGTNDFKLSRLCKLVTDAPPVGMCGVGDYKGKLVYRIGGGLQQLRDAQGKNSDESIQDVYLVGGVAALENWQKSASDSRVHCGTVIGTTGWKKDDVSVNMPLPFGSTQGDSGSPYFVWCGDAFKFLMAHHGSTSGNRQTFGCFAQHWAMEKMNADTVTVSMADVSGTLLISAAQKADDKGSLTDVFNGTKVTVSPAVSYLQDSRGNLYNGKGEAVFFRGVERGQQTWKTLSPLKNSDTWYTYGADYLQATDSVVVENKTHKVAAGVTFGKLYLTQNVHLLAPDVAAEYTVEPTEMVDLGAGYLHFDSKNAAPVTYHVSSAKKGQLNCAGYVLAPGVQVHMSLCNTDADYVREWRKVGAGTLRICGKGNNEILLNVGGPGLTILEQSGGYAAYNVLLNTGATLRIASKEQIARDLTIGAGGGTLDLGGNRLEWFSEAGHTRAGFSIHALTEDAVISNSVGTATLHVTEPGSSAYLGSFTDTKQGALRVLYESDSPWQLHSVRTALLNKESYFSVKKGHVTLSGSLTIHGYGTKHTRDSADFSTLPNDWHYADATMKVRVADKAVFALGSHARLTGDVELESGAVYMMHESVQHASECIEGGLRPESTAAIADFYGHKGNVKMEATSRLQFVSSPETDVPTIYNGNIVGPGFVEVTCGSDKAPFTLGGTNEVEAIYIKQGRLNVQRKTKTNYIAVANAATLAVQYEGVELMRFRGTAEKTALHQVTLEAVSPAECKLCFEKKRNPCILGSLLQVAEGRTLTVENAFLGSEKLISANAAFVRLTDVELHPETVARVKVPKPLTLKARPGVAPKKLKAKQAVLEYTFPQISGKAIVREGCSIIISLSPKEARAKVIRLCFDKDVSFEAPASVEVKLKIKNKLLTPAVYALPDEPNVLYLISR